MSAWERSGHPAHEDRFLATAPVLCDSFGQKRRRGSGLKHSESDLPVEVHQVRIRNAITFAIAEPRGDRMQHPCAQALPPRVLRDPHPSQHQRSLLRRHSDDSDRVFSVLREPNGIGGIDRPPIARRGIDREYTAMLIRSCNTDFGIRDWQAVRNLRCRRKAPRRRVPAPAAAS